MVGHPFDSGALTLLRQRTRRVVASIAAAVLLWWIALIVLAGWTPGLLATRLAGPVNLGHLLLLGQIGSTLGATGFYLWYARTRLDPLADDVEGRHHAR